MLELQVYNEKEMYVCIQVDEYNDNDCEFRSIPVPKGLYTVHVDENTIVVTLKKRL